MEKKLKKNMRKKKKSWGRFGGVNGGTKVPKKIIPSRLRPKTFFSELTGNHPNRFPRV